MCCRSMSVTTSPIRTHFERSPERGIGGILVADPADLEIAGRRTAAEYVIADTVEVEDFLDALAR
jgi:hypothetical protein